MSAFPPLPPAVSPDGSELWDWAGKAGQFIQREARIQEIRADLRRCGSVCGDCTKWMKSRECPREQPGTGKRSGYSVGPSMGDLKCVQFVETTTATKRRESLTAEPQNLES